MILVIRAKRSGSRQCGVAMAQLLATRGRWRFNCIGQEIEVNS